MALLLSRLRQPRRTATVVEKTFPAPIGGWNARDSIAAMKATDAVVLENWFPRPSFVEMRGGCVEYQRIIGSTIKTLAVYRELDGDEQMIAFTNAGVFDATFGGEAPASAMYVARTNGKHQWVQFGDGTNNWLIAVNGVDKPFYWHGTGYVLVDAVSSPAITGITSTDIVSVEVFKNRLLFIRNNKLGFDYLSAGVAGGAASYYDLSAFASKGGFLMAICVWSRDAGDGADDYAVFITSQGQALVYQGTDPSSANTWALVGTFQIGKPLGRRCVLKYGADPIILTEEGAFPLSALLASGDERARFAVSFKIQDAFSEAATAYGSVFGWKAISYPAKNALILNIPKAEDGAHEQYVMNTISKAWCKFTGWHAEDFAVFNDELYFCRGGRIYRAWYDEADYLTSDLTVGYNIVFQAQQAYMDFGAPAIKKPQMFMPLVELNKSVAFQTGIDTDFVTRAEVGTTTVSATGGFRWGDATWGSIRWGGGNTVQRNWGGTASWPGRWLSGKVRMATDDVSGKWIGSVMRFDVGDGL